MVRADDHKDMINLRVLSCAAAFVLAAVPAITLADDAAQPTTVVAGVAFVLVPFGESDAKDRHLADATNSLVKEMQAHGVTAVLAPAPMQGDVALSAGSLCATYKAAAIITGTYHADQTNKVNKLAFFVPSPVVWAGGMSYAPTHAIVKLDQLDCAGKITKHVQGDGNLTHHGQNADSTVTDTIGSAMHQAADRLTGVTTPDPYAAPATPAPAATPAS
jgi:hypothetical protein